MSTGRKVFFREKPPSKEGFTYVEKQYKVNPQNIKEGKTHISQGQRVGKWYYQPRFSSGPRPKGGQTREQKQPLTMTGDIDGGSIWDTIKSIGSVALPIVGELLQGAGGGAVNKKGEITIKSTPKTRSNIKKLGPESLREILANTRNVDLTLGQCRDIINSVRYALLSVPSGGLATVSTLYTPFQKNP